MCLVRWRADQRGATSRWLWRASKRSKSHIRDVLRMSIRTKLQPTDSIQYRFPDPPAPVSHGTLNTVMHVAFRRDLRRFDVALGEFPAGSRVRADQLIVAWEHFTFQLHLHHHDEEAYFWPAFQELGIARPLIDSLEGEHVAMGRALVDAEAAMEVFGAAPTAANASVARAALIELHGVLDDHLAHEERDLEPFAVRHHASKEHKGAAALARKAHTEGAGNFFAWLADACDPAVTRALRKEVPAPVLFVLIRIGGRRYQRLAAAAWGPPSVRQTDRPEATRSVER